MTDLIERLEAATEGSRELDEEIAQAIFPKLKRRHASWYIDDVRTNIEPFSTSLDAALTLVPEGLMWDVESRGAAFVGDPKMPSRMFEMAATPALALCIAALKARKANA